MFGWLFKKGLKYIISSVGDLSLNDDQEFEGNTLKSQLGGACNHFNIKLDIESNAEFHFL